MPSFHKEVEFKFEVYCNTCGERLCNQSVVTESWSRKYPMLRVDVCQNCVNIAIQKSTKLLDDEIEELKDEIKSLKETIEDLAND